MRESLPDTVREAGVTLKYGFVDAVDDAGVMAKVRLPDCDNLITGWLTRLVDESREDASVRPLALGTPVACLLDHRGEDGVILGARYARNHPPPDRSGTRRLLRTRDGAEFGYDHENHEYLIAIPAAGKARLTVGGAALEMTDAKIVLSVGGSSLEISASGIKLVGPRVELN